MKFEIKNRFTGAVLFTCELPPDIAAKPLGEQRGYALRAAVSARANLAGADLARANLADALNVPETNGSESIQSATAKQERPPRKTDAERAADFRARNPDIPVIESLDAKILAAIEGGKGTLDMSTWHKCETTHCRAGWAITLAGKAGAEPEEKYGPHHAGRLLCRAATGRVPHFFASNERALEDIREQAAKQS